MAKRWIKTAWVADTFDGGAWLVAAYDEATFEAWGEEPDFYCDEVKKHEGVRHMYVEIDDDAVRALFAHPTVQAIGTTAVEP